MLLENVILEFEHLGNTKQKYNFLVGVFYTIDSSDGSIISEVLLRNDNTKTLIP